MPAHNFNEFREISVLHHIVNAYTEPDRYYHNLNHIVRMFNIAKEHDIHLTEEQVMAIWFHDYVYNVPRSDISNEKLSASVALSYMEYGNYDNTFIEDVVTIIEDTEREEPTIQLSNIVIDLDLYDLHDNLKYIENGKLIRKEYSCFSDKEFINGRISWINSMLKRKSIYVSDRFNNSVMNNAVIENLKKDLKRLENGELL